MHNILLDEEIISLDLRDNLKMKLHSLGK